MQKKEPIYEKYPVNPVDVKHIECLLPDAMAKDRSRAVRELSRIRAANRHSKSGTSISHQLGNLEKRLLASKAEKERRALHKPEMIYPPELPITGKKDEIISAIKNHPVVIISGETGSGKTTQIPKFCIDAGRGIEGKIGCTQPRRIAAITIAGRIAEELGETPGTSIGYKIRFTDKAPENAYIKMMTDGILLAEAQKDPELSEYDTIIVDEAHERSLNIDFILGILKTLLSRRKDLKLIITSATIDTEKFSRAFDHAPIIEVSGRLYPVDVQYRFSDTEEDDDIPSYVENAVNAVNHLIRSYPSGDILVFMPTQQDITETMELIEGRKYRNTMVMPLFARLSASEQTRVFERISKRKIIVSTNIAETSITIPGIKYVIDTGLARIPDYTPRTRTTSLLVSPISKSSADQRKGRCGRVENGVCIRLYPEEDYLSRTEYTPPEILRSNLADVILRMIALQMGDIWNFPFIDKPAPKSITDGFDLLEELGAIFPVKSGRGNPSGTHYALTPKGRQMAQIPLDPRLSGMLIEARNQGCENEIAIIAAALSVMDPRERPLEKTAAADAAHAAFMDPSSDFMSLLKIWDTYHKTRHSGKSNSRLRKFCKENFLSFKRMREWTDVHGQLLESMDRMNFKPADPLSVPANGGATPPADPVYAAIHKAVLSGFLSNIAIHKEKNLYRAARGKEVMIFPGSTLFNKSRPWIVAAEIIETSRVFARTTAAVDPAWIEPIAGSNCKHSYSNPHWDQKRGEVVASEQVSLFGLIIVNDRQISYGKVDPDEAGKIFIQSALVDGRIDTPFSFMTHNRKLMNEAREMEDRIRRKDILVDDSVVFAFYDHHLKRCYSIKTLKKMLRDNPDGKFLRMTPEDIFRYTPETQILSQYPEHIMLGNQQLKCEYKFKPGENDDGITVKIPSSMASSLPGAAIDWLVPGLFREKITALIKGLPKSYRKQLVPISTTVDVICSEMPRGDGALLTHLAKFIFDRFKVDIPVSEWPENQLPEHLKMRISIISKNGKEIAGSRDRSILAENHDEDPRKDVFGPIRKKWEKTGITRWDFQDLPDSVEFRTDGTLWTLYPGLSIEENGNKAIHAEPSISLRLFGDRDNALAAHQVGIAVLYRLYFSQDVKFLKRSLVIPPEYTAAAKILGGKKNLEHQLVHVVMVHLFSKNIRTQEEFLWHAKTMMPVVVSKGRELLDQVLPVLKCYYEIRMLLDRLCRENRFKPVTLSALSLYISEMERLVPSGFISRIKPDRWPHLSRYLRAIGIRAERALTDPEKERTKSGAIKPHLENLDSIMKSITPDSSNRKKESAEDLFWLVEEYKVSIFAQELKTAVTVSDKILQSKVKEIERMA